jgi:hypothetical protein
MDRLSMSESDAASAEADDGRLLDGEASADHRDPQVIRRWVAVYSGLVAYKEDLKPVPAVNALALTLDAEREVGRIVNHLLLGERLAQYRRRLMHWQRAQATWGGQQGAIVPA